MNPHEAENNLAVPVGIDTANMINPGLVSEFVPGIPPETIVNGLNSVSSVIVPTGGTGVKIKRALTPQEEEERREKRRRREKEKRERESAEQRESRTAKRRARDNARKTAIIDTDDWEKRKKRRRENDKNRRERMTPEQREEHNEKRRSMDRARRESRANNNGSNNSQVPAVGATSSISVSHNGVNPVNPISSVSISAIGGLVTGDKHVTDAMPVVTSLPGGGVTVVQPIKIAPVGQIPHIPNL